MIRSSSLFLSLLLCSFILAGCGSKKRVVNPQDARSKRIAALKKKSTPGKISVPRVSQKPSHSAIVETKISPDNQESLEIINVRALQSTISFTSDRIIAYDKKLAAFQQLADEGAALNITEDQAEEVENCIRTLSSIKNSYATFHDQLLKRNERIAARLVNSQTFFNLQIKDISFLDGDCQKLPTSFLKKDPPPQVELSPKELREAEDRINILINQKAYQEVIEQYQQLPLVNGRKPSFATTYKYGQALLRNHKEKQALAVFQTMLKDIKINDFTNREFKLMRMIGDLQLALDNFPESLNQYNTLIKKYSNLAPDTDWARKQLSMVSPEGTNLQERKAYANVLKNYLAYNADRDGFIVARQTSQFLQQFPYSKVASIVENLSKESRVLAKEWFSSYLTEVDDLVNEKRFQQALIKLESLPRNILPAEQQEMLQTRVDEITTAEAIESETQVFLKEQDLQENWNSAMVHLEAKRYDDAIEAFQKLKNTSLRDKAQLRIDEAANVAAKDDRRRAAELFVRANRTHDLESRKKLLLGSRRLLKDILIKYPQSDLLPKVTNNLNRIEEEIIQIDPALLKEQSTVGTKTQNLTISPPIIKSEKSAIEKPRFKQTQPVGRNNNAGRETEKID